MEKLVSRTFINHQMLLSTLHIDTNTQLYTRETSTVTIHPGVILETILLVQLFMIGQAPLTLSFYTILINRNRFTLQLRTPSPTQILRSTRMTSVAPYLTRYIMLLGTFQSLSTDLQLSIILP